MLHNAYSVIEREEKAFTYQNPKSTRRIDMLGKNGLALKFCDLKDKMKLHKNLQ